MLWEDTAGKGEDRVYIGFLGGRGWTKLPKVAWDWRIMWLDLGAGSGINRVFFHRAGLAAFPWIYWLLRKTIRTCRELWGQALPGGVKPGHLSSLGVEPGSWRSLGAESTRGVSP